MVAKRKKLYCLGASGCKEPFMHTERGLITPCMELPWKLWLRVPLTAAPISLWSAPVIWVTQGWSSKQADSNDIIATDRFLKGRKISNGHASFENFPSVGGRWKGLSAQIWHVLPTLLAAYQFTSETFLLQIFFFSSYFSLWTELLLRRFSIQPQEETELLCAICLFGLCLTNILLGVYFPIIIAPNTEIKRDYFSVYISRTSLEKEKHCNY